MDLQIADHSNCLPKILIELTEGDKKVFHLSSDKHHKTRLGIMITIQNIIKHKGDFNKSCFYPKKCPYC